MLRAVRTALITAIIAIAPITAYAGDPSTKGDKDIKPTGEKGGVPGQNREKPQQPAPSNPPPVKDKK
jgi:hypothetical protein